MFSKVLVANRGEIALRVARACRELGIRTVAVYSTADRDSAVVRFADESVHIGPPPVKGSYLNIPAIIEATLQTGAQAIHPGYGFLSEDPDFAEICEANGIVFIGPPAQVMHQLGDKAAARTAMAQAGLPVLPGSTAALVSAAEAKALAQEVGFPVILKAVAGGGGRGMAVVRSADDVRLAYNETRAHAQAVFGDDRLYLERFVEDARHIEVQVLCDQHGSVVHLGERDCSVQRRHQKLIEESPASGVPQELREAMCAASVRGASAVGFVGAGTFEFVVTPDHEFYLMEINCRLQVEHPVTELVTGIDIVQEQITIAAGLPLSFGQSDVGFRGVALECRVNAEDPAREFAPAPGLLTEFVPPGGPFVRVDTHAYPGWVVGPDYDSLLAKAAVWAPDRAQALARMDRALSEFRVDGPGVRTTLGFLRQALAHPLFRTARHTTGFVARMSAEQDLAADGNTAADVEKAQETEGSGEAATIG
ncbi:acetyl-CoA carboxylase biotin carboxylase subunit [Streptomyces sp. H10-C2]|uniref:acetyl-CoA carboxylase biotin carboxylase subunit n=1 Tax=unclassified Streptomyces TaxID=2593676 RepID=UPI0024BAEE49|nr:MULTISPECIES: acetyl-CoA carboxylase biotin carboxylase subunit [unclassified Streptomyces]MDJ0345176.1 acetyl-CoA carboxylase biotin carboxylase subunit [Streptomyces sp. PH10-H1]MDJ0374144.1 acetyl-CoA carboxylase biotin carboxylase subunit [Streptomyces sp. H10-C2]